MNEVELNDFRVERLRLAIEKVTGGNKTEFGRRLGYKDGAFVRQMLAGSRPVREKTIRAIEKIPGMRGWFDIAGNADNKAKSSAPGRAENTQSMPGFTPLDVNTGLVTILRYDTGGSMGNGTVLRDQPGVIERLDVTREWLEKNVRGYTSARNLCVVTGFGDSMRPMYNPGDPLIVDSGVNTVEFDAVYFFRVGDEGFIKRLQRVPGKGLLAISENQAYRDWVIEPGMDMEVFGRVLKVWRSEDF